MKTSDRSALLNAVDEEGGSARLLGDFKKATLRGDPTAVYQTILLCSDNQVALPGWLADHLLQLIANYHQGVKPSWKGSGNRPLIVIRRRFEHEVRRRAVIAVQAWVKDRTKYQDLPTRCIQAWNDQDYLHSQIASAEDVLGFASYGIRGIKLHAEGPPLRCSTRTLRRAMEDKNNNHQPALSGRIAIVFGLTDPDSLFGTDMPLKPNLK